MEDTSRVCAEIDLAAIRDNFCSIKANLQEGTGILAVIKADGYGHGALPIARMLQEYDYIWGFAVATIDEAVALRGGNIRKPILILGYTFEEAHQTIVKLNITPTVFKLSTAVKLSKLAVAAGKTVSVHVKIDTGMSRIGLADTEESADIIRIISELPGIVLEGVFTHLARADEINKSNAMDQLARYNDFIGMLKERGVNIPVKHCANSAAAIGIPKAHMDMVRVGIAGYGIYPSKEVPRDKVKLRTAMTLKSHIAYLKEVEAGVPVGYGGTFVTTRKTKIGTVPVGYADGYPRSLSGTGWVLAGGQLAPILGRICMDQFMIDLTEVKGIKELDEVILIGDSEGMSITVDELSELSGRFPYEFVCMIGKRVPRIYK